MKPFSLLLRAIMPFPKIEDYDSFLFIGPHPDDIEVAAGATVARLSHMKKKIRFVIATDGCYGGDADVLTKEELVALRQKEAVASAEVLGVNDIRFLPFPDGGGYDERKLTEALTLEIADFKPDVILAPDPNLPTECHIDHLKVGRAAANAFLLAANNGVVRDFGGGAPASPKAIAFYYTDKPNRYFKTKGFTDKQVEALKKHSSQFTWTGDGKGTLELLSKYFMFRSVRFGIRSLKGRADGFRCLAPIHSHCCAEDL